MYPGVDGQLANASVTMQVRGAQMVGDFFHDAKTRFNVAVQSAHSTLYGATHYGNLKEWHDSFAINMKDLQTDSITAVLFVNDQEYGRSTIGLMDVAAGSGEAKSQRRTELIKNDKIGGYLTLYFEALAKQQVVGGLKPPKVTLRSGAPLPDEQPFVQRGIQKNAAQYLNLFSCMDASDMGWQPYPYKFKSRLRQTYDLKN